MSAVAAQPRSAVASSKHEMLDKALVECGLVILISL